MWTAKTDQTGRMLRLIWVLAGRTVTLLVLSCSDLFLVVCYKYMIGTPDQGSWGLETLGRGDSFQTHIALHN